MVSYLLAIFIGMLLMSVFNIVYTMPIYNIGPFHIILAVLANALIVFTIDAIVAYIIHKMPRKYFNPYSKKYKVWSFERKFYEAIGIRKWKDRIPEMGQLCDFKKDKIAEVDNNQYMFKFLEETCYAEVLHFLSAFLGFLVIFICPLKYVLCFSLPAALINFVLQILPAFIQRYLRPKLLKVYERNLRNSVAVNS